MKPVTNLDMAFWSALIVFNVYVAMEKWALVLVWLALMTWYLVASVKADATPSTRTQQEKK